MNRITRQMKTCGFCSERLAPEDETWQQWQCACCARWNDKASKPLKFRDVAINEPFDFIAPGVRNTFSDRCYKTGARTYRSFSSNQEYRVGSINAEVFHVGLLNTYRS